MTDFLGNELNLGDDVVYVFFCKTSSYLIKSKVDRITNKCVVMKDGTRKEPSKVIKIMNVRN